MKIIFSNYDDINNPYYGGGGAYAIFEVTKRLAASNDVTVITGKYPGSKDETIDGVKYKRIGWSWLPPKLAQIVFQLLLPFYAISMDYEVWLESFTPPYSTAFLPLFTRRPVIGVTHILAGRNMFEKYRVPFHLIENIGLKLYKQFIVLNEVLKRQIHQSNPTANIMIIPNGIDKKLIDLEFEKTGNNILFLGRIDFNQKGLDLLLDAYKHVADQISSDLIIAGDGMEADVKQLKEKIDQLGLGHKVKYIGKVMGEEKDRTYREAKIFVMSSRYEALPLTIFEAFSYKCVLVYFGIEVLDWIPENLGVRVKPFDTKLFGETLLSLSKDDQKVKAISTAAKSAVKNHDWKKVGLEYQSILDKIVKKA
jgi:phosphatidyl-myo-inositol alpha-mannosyltransferase